MASARPGAGKEYINSWDDMVQVAVAKRSCEEVRATIMIAIQCCETPILLCNNTNNEDLVNTTTYSGVPMLDPIRTKLLIQDRRFQIVKEGRKVQTICVFSNYLEIRTR
jgi:hypothetical protein